LPITKHSVDNSLKKDLKRFYDALHDYDKEKFLNLFKTETGKKIINDCIENILARTNSGKKNNPKRPKITHTWLLNQPIRKRKKYLSRAYRTLKILLTEKCKELNPKTFLIFYSIFSDCFFSFPNKKKYSKLIKQKGKPDDLIILNKYMDGLECDLNDLRIAAFRIKHKTHLYENEEY